MLHGRWGIDGPPERPRGVASSRLMLRWLKTVVVSDEEKAHVMRQAGTRKTITAEASKLLDDIRTGVLVCAPG